MLLFFPIGALLIMAEIRISNIRKELVNYSARNAASAAATAGIENSLDTDKVRYADLIKFGRDKNGNIVQKGEYSHGVIVK